MEARSHKLYFVVAEINRTGFIIGALTALPKAKSIYEKLSQRMSTYPYTDPEKSVEAFSGHRSYVIHNELHIAKKYRTYTGNGIVSLYVIKLEDHWDSIDSFVKHREIQQELFLEV